MLIAEGPTRVLAHGYPPTISFLYPCYLMYARHQCPPRRTKICDITSFRCHLADCFFAYTSPHLHVLSFPLHRHRSTIIPRHHPLHGLRNIQRRRLLSRNLPHAPALYQNSRASPHALQHPHYPTLKLHQSNTHRIPRLQRRLPRLSRPIVHPRELNDVD